MRSRGDLCTRRSHRETRSAAEVGRRAVGARARTVAAISCDRAHTRISRLHTGKCCVCECCLVPLALIQRRGQTDLAPRLASWWHCAPRNGTQRHNVARTTFVVASLTWQSRLIWRAAVPRVPVAAEQSRPCHLVSSDEFAPGARRTHLVPGTDFPLVRFARIARLLFYPIEMWCLVSQANSVVLEVQVDPKAIGQECLEKVRLCFLIQTVCKHFFHSFQRIFCSVCFFFLLLM